MNARKVLDSVKSRLNIPTDKELAAAMGVQYGALTSALSRGSIQYEAVINLLLKENVNLNEIFGDIGNVQIINEGIRGGQNAQSVGRDQSQSSSPTKYEIDEALLKLIQNAVVMVDADEEKINQLKALIKKWTMEQI